MDSRKTEDNCGECSPPVMKPTEDSNLSWIRNPFVKFWVSKNNLKVENSCTQYGMIAQYGGDHSNSEYFFDSKRRESELERLGKNLGVSFDLKFLEVGTEDGAGSLIDVYEKLEAYCEKTSEICPRKLFIYIPGITIPDRSLLYVEFIKPSGGDSLTCCDSWSAIPLDKSLVRFL